jgi:hypothetical protein
VNSGEKERKKEKLAGTNVLFNKHGDKRGKAAVFRQKLSAWPPWRRKQLKDQTESRSGFLLKKGW